MATQIKFRRDTRANLELSTPVEAEIGVDTTNDRLILGDGSTSGGIPQASYKDIQNNLFTAVDAVGTDTITLTLDDAPTAYAEYQSFTFKPAANNTGAVTVNVNTLGAKNLKKDDGSGSLVDMEADDLKANIPLNIIYDGTQFIANLGGGGSLKPIASVDITSSVSRIDFNSVFETGKIYQVFINGLSATTSFDVLFRFSSGGVELASLYEESALSTVSNYSSTGNSRISLLGGTSNASQGGVHGSINFFNTSVSLEPAITWDLFIVSPSTGVPYRVSGSGHHDNSYSYDGFSLIASAGNFDAGKIAIYERLLA